MTARATPHAALSTRRTPWSEAEVAVLMANVDLPPAELAQLFPDRTTSGIESKRRELHMRRPRPPAPPRPETIRPPNVPFVTASGHRAIRLEGHEVAMPYIHSLYGDRLLPLPSP